MATQYVQWDNSYSAPLAGLSAASVAAGAEVKATNAISNDQKWSTEVGVEISYGSTAPDSVEVRIYAEVDDGVYATNPTAVFPIPATASSVERQRFEVPGAVSEFKVGIYNPSTNGSVTASVQTKQSTLESV